MKVPSFRIRTVMIMIGVTGVLIGGVIEYQRLSERRQNYLTLASGFAGSVRMRRSDYEAAKKEFDRLRQSPNSDGMQLELAAARMNCAAAQVSSTLHITLIFEHAASHPWETPPDTADPIDPVSSSLMDRFPPNLRRRRSTRAANH